MVFQILWFQALQDAMSAVCPAVFSLLQFAWQSWRNHSDDTPKALGWKEFAGPDWKAQEDASSANRKAQKPWRFLEIDLRKRVSYAKMYSLIRQVNVTRWAPTFWSSQLAHVLGILIHRVGLVFQSRSSEAMKKTLLLIHRPGAWMEFACQDALRPDAFAFFGSLLLLRWSFGVKDSFVLRSAQKTEGVSSPVLLGGWTSILEMSFTTVFPRACLFMFVESLENFWNPHFEGFGQWHFREELV